MRKYHNIFNQIPQYWDSIVRKTIGNLYITHVVCHIDNICTRTQMLWNFTYITHVVCHIEKVENKTSNQSFQWCIQYNQANIIRATIRKNSSDFYYGFTKHHLPASWPFHALHGPFLSQWWRQGSAHPGLWLLWTLSPSGPVGPTAPSPGPADAQSWRGKRGKIRTVLTSDLNLSCENLVNMHVLVHTES